VQLKSLFFYFNRYGNLILMEAFKFEPQLEKQKTYYELITSDEINKTVQGVKSGFNVNLDNVTISSVKPGDFLFDWHELQHKLFLKCHSDFNKLLETIKDCGCDPNDIKEHDLQIMKEKEGISLDGNFPGFALSSGDDEIFFLAVNDSNAIEMAEKYANKEGENLNFATVEEAVEYLCKLSKKILLHEIGHIIYARGEFDGWNEYIINHPKIADHVVELQKDKYNDTKQVPIFSEAFADFCVDVLSKGQLNSRLGKNEEAFSMIRNYLKHRLME